MGDLHEALLTHNKRSLVALFLMASAHEASVVIKLCVQKQSFFCIVFSFSFWVWFVALKLIFRKTKRHISPFFCHWN